MRLHKALLALIKGTRSNRSKKASSLGKAESNKKHLTIKKKVRASRKAIGDPPRDGKGLRKPSLRGLDSCPQGELTA